MNKSFLGRCALILITLVALSPAVPLKAMDASGGQAESDSTWFTTAAMAVGPLAPVVGYGYLYRKHYNELHAIERQLDLATVSASAREGNFRFALWRSTEGNTPDVEPWKDASEVSENGDTVVSQLIHDAQKCEDRVYVNDDAGLRFEPGSVKLPAIKKAIAREKQLLEAQLALVAQYTDMPNIIVQQLGSAEVSTLSAHELVLSCAQKVTDNETASKLTVVEEQIHNSYVKPTVNCGVFQLPLKSIVNCGGWLPTNWTFAPCYQKASRLYLKLFQAYARLCALDTVINRK